MSGLPNGWVETTVEEIASEMGDAPFGAHLKTKDYTESGVIVVQGKNVQGRAFDWSDRRFVLQEKYASIPRSHCFVGDLIFPKVGTIGKVGILSPHNNDTQYLLSTNTMRFKADPQKANQLFVYYYFIWNQTVKYIHALNANSVQPVFNYTSLKKFPIVLPPVEEQNEIVSILDSIEKKIELLRSQNETLENLAQTLFKEWFVDDTEASKLSISELIEFNPREKIDRKVECLFFDMKTLPTDSMVMAEGIYKKASSASTFRENDTLFAKITPCLENGKTAFVLDLAGEEIARGSTEFIVMRAKENGSPYFNYCLARHPHFRDFAQQSMIGTSGRQRVPVERIESYEVNVDFSKIDSFSELVKPMFDKVKENARQINALSKTRDTLLPKLLNGSVRVQGFEE